MIRNQIQTPIIKKAGVLKFRTNYFDGQNYGSFVKQGLIKWLMPSSFYDSPTWGMQLPPPMKGFGYENDLTGKIISLSGPI